MTCKTLTNKLQSLNEGMKIEVKKVTGHGRITGNTTSYQLQVNHCKKNGNTLTLKSRYGKHEIINIKVA